MTPQQQVDEALKRAGRPPGCVVIAKTARQAPTGPWVVVPMCGQYVVGGVGRGTFAPYDGAPSLVAAARLAIRLACTPPPRRTAADRDALLSRGARTAAGISERIARRGGKAGPAELVVGDVLDCVGPETGHHLYALGTTFGERAQQPSDLGSAYHCYELVQPLATSGLELVAAPGFGQPGGGAMVVLSRPIRWLVDGVFLIELAEEVS